MTDLSGAFWCKSTPSGDNGGACVEVATDIPDLVAVRDSEHIDGPALRFEHRAWLCSQPP
ncbi:DUF397 domain-containing protein [Micromonospora sp. C81]|uniref:DUF397 domain-containing protein n=1 Tax=Micromonospora sp. C81 TaxID=2824881 RepID=UPI001B366296|nr:DUF397 domain-containing protein [Micromonospora sp. C81]MBQ1035107.1 DUF397 domain-containing protein [Micromonospora sp. C81]